MKRENPFHGKKCAYCGRFFQPDPRVGSRQKNCKKAACQKKRKQAQEKRWLAQSPDYFKGRYGNTQAWREAHPGYQKQWRAEKRREIQTQYRPESPVKSVRLHLRGLAGLGEIQTQFLRVSQVGQDVWVYGCPMQPERDTNAEGQANTVVAPYAHEEMGPELFDS